MRRQVKTRILWSSALDTFLPTIVLTLEIADLVSGRVRWSMGDLYQPMRAKNKHKLANHSEWFYVRTVLGDNLWIKEVGRRILRLFLGNKASAKWTHRTPVIGTVSINPVILWTPCHRPCPSSTTPATRSSWPGSSGIRGISWRSWWRRMFLQPEWMRVLTIRGIKWEWRSSCNEFIFLFSLKISRQ